MALPAAAGAAPSVRIVVRHDAGLTRGERAEARADAGVERVAALRIRDTEVVTAPAAAATRAVRRLNADPDVVYAAPDVRLHAAGADPYLSRQLGLVNSGQWSGVADSDIDADDAWAVTRGAGVRVAVVDTKLGEHPDLTADVGSGASFVQTDDCAAASPTPDHGTHVAGIIAAVQGNDVGVSGVAPHASVVPVQALDNCGSGSLSWVLEAFDYAGEHAQIVSASLATDPWLTSADKTAIDDAFASVIGSHPDTLYVTAAGNEGNDNDARPGYPCNTDAANVVCVGASGVSDVAACWSNVGHASVDLFAPGEHIYSTADGAYEYMDGTSMATPMVAGAAALVWSQRAGESGPAVKAALLATTDAKSGMSAISVSGGRLNAGRAVGQSLALGGGDGVWQTCDRDHDGVADTRDSCPDTPAPGAVDGCPADADADGVPDASDDCRAIANPVQADADADGIGDACDATPRGPDVDGDGKAALDDRCPAQFAPTSDGCPATATSPPPSTVTGSSTAAGAHVVSLSVRRTRRHSARITVRLSAAGEVMLRVERKVRGSRWGRVTVRVIHTAGRVVTLTVRGNRGRGLRPGRYRAIATAATPPSLRRGFRIR